MHPGRNSLIVISHNIIRQDCIPVRTFAAAARHITNPALVTPRAIAVSKAGSAGILPSKETRKAKLQT